MKSVIEALMNAHQEKKKDPIRVSQIGSQFDQGNETPACQNAYVWLKSL